MKLMIALRIPHTACCVCVGVTSLTGSPSAIAPVWKGLAFVTTARRMVQPGAEWERISSIASTRGGTSQSGEASTPRPSMKRSKSSSSSSDAQLSSDSPRDVTEALEDAACLDSQRECPREYQQGMCSASPGFGGVVAGARSPSLSPTLPFSPASGVVVGAGRSLGGGLCGGFAEIARILRRIDGLPTTRHIHLCILNPDDPDNELLAQPFPHLVSVYSYGRVVALITAPQTMTLEKLCRDFIPNVPNLGSGHFKISVGSTPLHANCDILDKVELIYVKERGASNPLQDPLLCDTTLDGNRGGVYDHTVAEAITSLSGRVRELAQCVQLYKLMLSSYTNAWSNGLDSTCHLKTLLKQTQMPLPAVRHQQIEQWINLMVSQLMPNSINHILMLILSLENEAGPTI